jgi:antitoxin (DNA-binding transcriptional repressor) of toxin-antitoxin stability system
MVQLTLVSGLDGFNRVLACRDTFPAQIVRGTLELAFLSGFTPCGPCAGLGYGGTPHVLPERRTGVRPLGMAQAAPKMRFVSAGREVYLEMSLGAHEGTCMDSVINVKQLRAELPRIVLAVSRGDRFTVLYRSRPAFDIVPPGDAALSLRDAATDSLYRAEPVGRSAKGNAAAEHDRVLYG